MDTARVYFDSDDNECTIYQMVRRYPDWAASRIQEGEKALVRIAELEAQLNLYQERVDWLLSRCSVNSWDGITLTNGKSDISGQNKLESICRIDKAIFRSKNNAL